MGKRVFGWLERFGPRLEQDCKSGIRRAGPYYHYGWYGIRKGGELTARVAMSVKSVI